MAWYRFISTGKVQGVFYRKYVSRAMMLAGYNGYIRNLSDGRVETVVFIVDMKSDLPSIQNILEKGSPMSEVEKAAYEMIDDVEMESNGFEIRY